MSNTRNRRLITTSIISGLGLAAIPALAIVLGSSSNAFATGVSGDVQLNTEVSTSLAMKIVSPNDLDPDCMVQSGVTYGTVNRYTTSNGAEGSKQVDTFDGTAGGTDEINTNTSCATLSMSPNTFDSTYSDVTVYTNNPNGYAVSLQAAQPNLVNTDDNTQYIAAGALTESNNTVTGGQNKWAYKTDNGIITNWTAVTTTDTAIKSYDQVTSGGETTRVTYGISAGNNPAGRYATTLTYTATMFDGFNPYVSKLDVTASDNMTISANNLSIPFGKSAQITATPAEGYYLSSVTCPEGFTCSGYDIDIDNTEPQTITVTNQNTDNTGTVGVSATEADPWRAAGCDNATKDNPCTVNGVQYMKLADGHYWTRYSQGNSTWPGSNLCPAGTSQPSSNIYANLISAYGGNNGNLYATTNWSPAYYWSSTEYDRAEAFCLGINTSTATTYPFIEKTSSRPILCYR